MYIYAHWRITLANLTKAARGHVAIHIVTRKKRTVQVNMELGRGFYLQNA